jgi:hypothetical protein
LTSPPAQRGAFNVEQPPLGRGGRSINHKITQFMYSLEQIEKIWQTARPLYYRLVEGEKANGLHRNTDFFEYKKTDNLDDAARTVQSQALWERFVSFLEMINDGYYTVIIQANKTASASAAPYHFAKGDVSMLPEKKAVGSAFGKQNTEGGSNWGAAAQSPMLFMMNMMQQGNNQMLTMMQQSNERQTALMQEMFKKDMEIHAMGQAKNIGDKLMGVLEKPHVWGFLSKLAPAQAVAIGRLQADVNEQVPRPSEVETPPPAAQAPRQEDVNRLQALLKKVAEANPDKNPIEVLDEGFDQVQAFLAMQGQL